MSEVVIPNNPIPSIPHRDYVVFAVPSIQPLAQSLCRSIQDKYPSAHITQGHIDYKSFPDGFPNIHIHNAADLSQKDVIYICSFDTSADIFIQLSTLYMFPSYCVRSLTVICPYIPTGTMERADIMGQVPTAVTLAKMFGIIPLHCRLLIVDLHTHHNLYYFPANISPMFIHAVPSLLLKLNELDKEAQGKITIVFPDEGAAKRYRLLFNDYPQVLCSKIRKADERIVTIIEGDCTDRDVYVIDDLVHSGGTLIECINVCWAHKCKTVNVYTTHGIFENDTYSRFIDLAKENKLNKFYLANTHPSALKLLDTPPFVILDVSKQLADHIA